MGKVTARLTMFAEPVEVDETELPNLRGQGLLIEDEAAEAESGDRSGGSGDDGAGEGGQQPRTRTPRGPRSGDSNGEPV